MVLAQRHSAEPIQCIKASLASPTINKKTVHLVIDVIFFILDSVKAGIFLIWWKSGLSCVWFIEATFWAVYDDIRKFEHHVKLQSNIYEMKSIPSDCLAALTTIIICQGYYLKWHEWCFNLMMG